MPSHTSHDSSSAPGVSAAGTPGEVPDAPASRGRGFAAHSIGGGLAPALGLPGPLLGAALRAVGAAGVQPNPGFHR